MSAVDRFAQEGGKDIIISFVIYADGTRNPLYVAFVECLRTVDYVAVRKEVGEAGFDIARWIIGMRRDEQANS